MASNAECCSPVEKIGSVVVSGTKYAKKVKDVRDKLARISQVMTARLANPPRGRRPPVSTRRRQGQDLLHALDALAAATASAAATAADHGTAVDHATATAVDHATDIATASAATITADHAIAADHTTAVDHCTAIPADHATATDHATAIASPEHSLLSVVERSGFTWPMLVEETIMTMLSSMTVEALNERMETPCLPDEPCVEDLEERDALCFPSRHGVSENNSVIPASILDDLLDAPDEIAMSGVMEVEGVQNTLSRNDVDAARCFAFDAANDYLGRLRASKARRLPSNGPTRRGRCVHRVEGFRFFRSVEEAVMDVTKAVMADDGGYGREAMTYFPTPLDSKREDWVDPEEDDYFVKCKLTEDILMELLGDTVEECKRVYNM